MSKKTNNPRSKVSVIAAIISLVCIITIASVYGWIAATLATIFAIALAVQSALHVVDEYEQSDIDDEDHFNDLNMYHPN